MSKPVGGQENPYINYSTKENKKDPRNESPIPLDLVEESLALTPLQDTPLDFHADPNLSEPLANLAQRIDDLVIGITPNEFFLPEEMKDLPVTMMMLSLINVTDIFNAIANDLEQAEPADIMDQLYSESKNSDCFLLNNKLFVKESEQHLVHERVKEARKSNPHLDKFVAYVVKDEEWEEFKEQIVTFLKEMITVLSARMERGEKRNSAKKTKAAPKTEEMRRGREEMNKGKRTSAKPGVDWNEVQTERDKQIKDRISEERASEINHNKEFAAKKKLKKFRDTERKEKKREEVRLENLARENQRREMGI